MYVVTLDSDLLGAAHGGILNPVMESQCPGSPSEFT